MSSLLSFARERLIVLGAVGPEVTLLQTLLRKDGAEVVTDGKFGSFTLQAVMAFQSRHGLTPDGVVGPQTAKVLDDLRDPAPLPSVAEGVPWLTTMRAITGTREIPGWGKSNPLILSWSKVIAENYPDLAGYSREMTDDDIAWCGQATAYVMAANDIKPVTKADGAKHGYYWADDWKYSGVACPLMVGAVGVFTRNGGGHVALIEGWTKTHAIIRGGNQSNMVNVTSMSLDKLTATRWPKDWKQVEVRGLTSNLAAAGSVA